MKDADRRINESLETGKNLPPTPSVQSQSVGSGPKARKRKISEVQGIRKIVKDTMYKLNNGLR